jgi:hypothetical protein
MTSWHWPDSGGEEIPFVVIELARETWELVLSELTVEQMRPLLDVNRLLHSLALHSLFHLIHIYLGPFESIDPALNNRGNSPEPDEQALARSLDILGGIVQNTLFRTAVWTLVVRIYSKEKDVINCACDE